MPHVSRTRLYWTCQLGGWALALGSMFGLDTLSGRYRTMSAPELVYTFAMFYAVSVAATHWIHVTASQREWLDLPLRALVPRLALAVMAAAVAAQAVGSVIVLWVDPLLVPGREHPLPPVPMLGHVTGTLWGALMFAVWATVYVLVVTAFRLADAERDRLGLRAALAESRSRALEYQLNPHFLFNALNTVRALTREDAGQARRAVTSLSGLLRRTLVAGRETTHALRAELALVETYLDLEAARFEDRLKIRLEVADDALEAAVPALLLQTLVENAVTHGVARRKRGGEVVVRAALEDGPNNQARLRLEVENPVGPAPANPETSGTGTGLANARERLALLFGDAATLDLEVGAERAVASVTLPVSVTHA